MASTSPETSAAAASAKGEEDARIAAIDGLRAKAAVRGLLKSTLRATLSDGRVVTGQFLVRML